MSREGTQRITVCYVPGSEAASNSYESLGFHEIGKSNGEMVAEIVARGG
ncbi:MULTISPECIES: hypothetical protein [Halomonadaceae]|nr:MULTISPECIES: hypothetical protein [Halomonas]MDI4637581.1 hypothetical protein [Halomonas sp. BMC7]NUJ58601.1 hypothetical protein [Halomonas taeanensis]